MMHYNSILEVEVRAEGDSMIKHYTIDVHPIVQRTRNSTDILNFRNGKA